MGSEKEKQEVLVRERKLVLPQLEDHRLPTLGFDLRFLEPCQALARLCDQRLKPCVVLVEVEGRRGEAAVPHGLHRAPRMVRHGHDLEVERHHVVVKPRHDHVLQVEACFRGMARPLVEDSRDTVEHLQVAPYACLME